MGHSKEKIKKTINALGTVSNPMEYREKNSPGVAAFLNKFIFIIYFHILSQYCFNKASYKIVGLTITIPICSTYMVYAVGLIEYVLITQFRLFFWYYVDVHG